LQILFSEASSRKGNFEPSSIQTKKFYGLTLDLPETPLVRTSNKLQTVKISELINTSFNNVKTEYNSNLDKTISYEKRITELPDILFIKLHRFTKIENVWEKNNTIVLFNPRELIVNVKSPEKKNSGLKSDGNSESSSQVKFKMIANIVHEGLYETGSYKIQIFKEEWNEWYEVSEGNVREIIEDRVKCSETIIQVYSKIKS
jgi:ubiquitin C-terminal hydrolase